MARGQTKSRPKPKIPILRSRGMGTVGNMWVDVNYDAMHMARKLNGGVVPYCRALETTKFPHCDEWSEENLPAILFYLVVPKSKYKGIPVYWLYDENGEVVKSQDDHQLRDIEILPRRISVNVEAWLIEAWRRIDCRITYSDILDRQETDPTFGAGIGLRKLDKNALQNHCRRMCRQALNSWVEYGRRSEPHRTDVQTVENLSYQNFADNTVLTRSAEFPGRLQKVRLVRENGKEVGLYIAEPVPMTAENVHQTSYPVNFFTRAMPVLGTPDNAMSDSMLAAWELLMILSERATLHGLHSWQQLKKPCLPVTWYDRTKAKGKANETYDGACEICTWRPGGTPRPPLPLAKGQKRARKPTRISTKPRHKQYRTRQAPRAGCAKNETDDQDNESQETETPVTPTPVEDDGTDDQESANEDSDAVVGDEESEVASDDDADPDDSDDEGADASDDEDTEDENAEDGLGAVAPEDNPIQYQDGWPVLDNTAHMNMYTDMYLLSGAEPSGETVETYALNNLGNWDGLGLQPATSSMPQYVPGYTANHNYLGHRGYQARPAPLSLAPTGLGRQHEQQAPVASGAGGYGREYPASAHLPRTVDHFGIGYGYGQGGMRASQAINYAPSQPGSVFDRYYGAASDRRRSLNSYQEPLAPQSVVPAQAYGLGNHHGLDQHGFINPHGLGNQYGFSSHQLSGGHGDAASGFHPLTGYELQQQGHQVIPTTVHLSQVQPETLTLGRPVRPADLQALKYPSSPQPADDDSLDQRDTETAALFARWPTPPPIEHL